ncbi:MAG: helix-turn-helix transcriptional regulator, partial [bacterium]|nr:helix-turn-helix transcriptional regulator [bacterium]
MDKKQIGLRIRSLRGEKGLRQEDLASQLRITRANLSKIETGEVAPTSRILMDLKQIFATSTDWVLSGSGSREYTPGEYSGDIKAMLDDMGRYVQLKHAILSFYYTYINRELRPKFEEQTAED